MDDFSDKTDYEQQYRTIGVCQIEITRPFGMVIFGGAGNLADMENAGRLLTHDWNEYDYGNTVVRPTDMSPGEMLEGFTRLYQRFYSLPSMARRFWTPAPANYGEGLFYSNANLKINRFLKKTTYAWGTIS